MTFDIQAALKAAHPGDTIEVPAGEYGDLAVVRRAWSKPVTLIAADPKRRPLFNSMSFVAVSGLNVLGMDVHRTPDADTVSNTATVRVAQGSSNITFRDMSVRGGNAVVGIPETADPNVFFGEKRPGDNILGWPTGRGFSIEFSNHISILACDVSVCHRGITFSQAPDCTVADTSIHDLRSTFIDGGGVDRIQVLRNRMWAAKPWKLGGKGDHADFAHFWSIPGKPATDGVTIVGNLMDIQTGAHIPGISLDDNNRAIGFTNATVTDNTLLAAHAAGYVFENTSGIAARNLALMVAGDTRHNAPSFRRVQGSTIVFIENTGHDLYKAFAAPRPGDARNTILPNAVQPVAVIAAARARFGGGHPSVPQP